MIKQKKKIIVECPKCSKEVAGFSKHHSKMNLMIHLKTSKRCKEIQEILKKKGLYKQNEN